jgi:alpha-ribazole phosphatase/probable phosphoglycerate mutase
MDEQEQIIDLIRHGEPEGGRKYRGQSDDPLNERGWQQMWAAVGAARPWRRILTSPLSRCQAFAAALSKEMGSPLAEDKRLMEIGFGVWEGHTVDEIRTFDETTLFGFWQDPENNRPEGAETLTGFAERVSAAFNEHTAHPEDSPLLVVAHAGVMRRVIAEVLGMELHNMYRLQIPYAGIVRLRGEPGRWRLTHLAPVAPNEA